MILLLGGTSEAGTIAAALAAAGVPVLVSTATALASSVREAGLVTLRVGMLDEAGLHEVIVETRARAVVDATHPYASAVTLNAQRAAARAGVPYLRYLRPPSVTRESGVFVADDHEQAARRAFVSGRPVLLTIGTRNLEPYLREAGRTSVPVAARVLSTPESLLACQRSGLAPENVIVCRGTSSVEENVEIIRRHRIGVLVTKDGGAEGGVPEKLEAARREGCAVVVVARPEETIANDSVYCRIGALVDACVAATGITVRRRTR